MASWRPPGFRSAPASSPTSFRNGAPDTWQRIGVTALLGLGFLPLVLALETRIGLFVGAMLAVAFAGIRWPGLRPGGWTLGLLTLAGGLNVIDTYQGIAGQHPGTALLLTMLSLKLLEVRTRRDLRVLLLVFGFLVVVQFLFDQSPARTLLMGALLVANFALLFDLAQDAHAGSPLGRARRAGRVALSMMLQAIPLALLLFVFFPRLDTPLWDLGLENPYAITGLNDWLEPGSVTQLIISGEDALRVRFDRDPGIPVERMYWRGPVLWHNDGRRWVPARVGEFAQASPQLRPEAEALSYTVAMEPTNQPWLIGLDLPTQVPSDARLSADFQVLAAAPVDEFRIYRMTSVPVYSTLGLSPDEAQAALALPGNVTPRMRTLVEGWQADGAAPEAIVQRALQHFGQPPFSYTLLPPALGANPVDAFLFDARAGFCEHYAAAFAVLMRIAGIPSRIVLGYLGGERNPINGEVLVRQSEAHAWNEVWLADRGWVRIDPTAAIDPARVDADRHIAALGAGAPARFRVDDQGLFGKGARGLRLLADALGSGWRQWVVGFSTRNQRQLLDRLDLGPLRDLGLVLGMVIGGALIMLAWNLLLARPSRPRDPLLRAYQRFMRRLSPLGLARRPTEGPVDHRNRIDRARPDLTEAVDAILAPYLRLRYGGSQDPADLQQLRQRIARFRPARRAPTDMQD
ncbi:transglutaminase TgpA family protein [Thiohalocapsa marina]|nr:DUF3488 and transglutaminase-like domain-containing protein [Thiohalocapsa marina]